MGCLVFPRNRASEDARARARARALSSERSHGRELELLNINLLIFIGTIIADDRAIVPRKFLRELSEADRL